MSITHRPRTGTAAAPIDRAGKRQILPLVVLSVLIAVVASIIGKVTIPVGPATISIFPMVWGLILGALISMQKVKPVPVFVQRTANALLGLFVLFLVARLSFNIGPELRTILQAGPALLLQEVGHFLGTIVLALPLAVALKMGPATIGATFSLDREPAFAMVNEKYGPDSDQYRGVLAMYVFGTLFGAVIISFLTSLVASLDIFDPGALAMGVGVGSGSMMAAGIASIVDIYPDAAATVSGLAAVSNLITTVGGVYVGVFIALPLADKFYHFLTRGKQADAVVSAEEGEANRALREKISANMRPVSVPLWASFAIINALGLFTATIETGGWDIKYLWGYLTMDALVALSMLLHKAFKPISTIIWVTTLGTAISSPWSPLTGVMHDWVGSVDYLSLCTVVLVMAGLSIGKDAPLLRQIGWKIIPVGVTAIVASFLFSVVIAEFSLGMWTL